VVRGCRSTRRPAAARRHHGPDVPGTPRLRRGRARARRRRRRATSRPSWRRCRASPTRASSSCSKARSR
jgi:hypothetical protein